MKTIEQIKERLEDAGISVNDYTEGEKEKLCGYELNTYTDCGVNQIIFLDFRDSKLNPKVAEDFLVAYHERVNSIDIDEEIEINRYSEDYKKAFSLTVSIEDFKNWKESLENVFEPKGKTAEQRQFEQTKDKLTSLYEQMEDALKLIPRKGQTPSECQRTEISNHLGGLHHAINGLELEDFTPNNWSGDFKLSYQGDKIK